MTGVIIFLIGFGLLLDNHNQLNPPVPRWVFGLEVGMLAIMAIACELLAQSIMEILEWTR